MKQKMMKIGFKKMAMIIIAVMLFTICAGGVCYALPFNIFPQGTLPTQITAGGSATALYTVQNNTASTRANNFVKYLPPNVAQVTSDPSISNLCGARFNLAARGKPGDSCTLELNITGAVNASDPNPHHHLFVCFPGGAMCAGTAYPLNVTTTATQFAYIGNNFRTPPTPSTSNFITICQVNPAGGSLSSCTQQEDSTNTIFSGPVDVVVNNSATRAYVLNINGPGTNSNIQSCAINADGTLALGSCTSRPLNQSASGGGLHPNGLFLYVSIENIGLVLVCPINQTDGSVGACTQTPALPTPNPFTNPNGRIAFNPAGTVAYVPDFGAPGVFVCAVDQSNGNLNNCVLQNPSGNLTGPLGADMNTVGNYLFVANTDNSVYSCSIVNNSLDACTQNPGFHFNEDVCNLFLSNKQIAYIPNDVNASTVTFCSADPSTGLLSNCFQTGGTFNFPSSAWLTNAK